MIPYLHPIQAGFRASEFRAATRRHRPLVEKRAARGGFFRSAGHPWVSHWPSRDGTPRASGRAESWSLKLYACVGPASYWPFVTRCMTEFVGESAPWKFFLGERGYERPDKVVFYPDTPAALRRLIARVRPLLPRRGLHDLAHAGATAAMGLEAEGARGLFVGADPGFIAPSWRVYRSHCAAWAGFNEDFLKTLPGGRARWFRRMNLSLVHEGPARLSPSRSDAAFVRRQWRAMHAGAR